ncbi:hypothetical protein Tco_1377357 [Tanacetum coccineum]
MLGPAFRLLKGTRSNYAELEYDFEECYKALLEKLDWENPEGGDYPFDLSKPLPLIKRGKRQRVPFEYFINNDLKYLQGGVLTMTYTTSTTKSKAAQYDLPGIEDMVPNIWSPVKVAYDRYALWGISHWREQRKSFYAYARGIQSRGDVYSTKRILAVTHVKVMRKHGYGYLEEIVVRRADNVFYEIKEGDLSPNSPGSTEFGSMISRINVKFCVLKRLTNLQRMIHYQEYRHGVLAEEKMEHIGKEKSSFHDQDINKLLKEILMMRSLSNFISGRLYGIDLKTAAKINMTLHMVVHTSQNVISFYTSAGNPVKEILLKLNLPDHRSILTDSKEYIKMDMERRSVKVKELRERCIITAFKLSNQEWYEHVGPKVTSSQDGKVYKMAKRDYAWLMISSCSRSHFSQTSQDKGTSSSLKSKITTIIHKLMIEVKDYELKTKVEA